MAYAYPELFMGYFPNNKIIEDTQKYGVWAAVLSTTSFVVSVVPALRSSKNLYMLSGACILFSATYFASAISVLPLLFVAGTFLSEAKYLEFSPNKSLKDAP